MKNFQHRVTPGVRVRKMEVHSPEVEMGQFFLSNILDENGQVPSDIPSDTKNSIRVVH